MFNVKKHKKLMFKIANNIYFKCLKKETKDKLVVIDDSINNNDGFLWDYELFLILRVLEVYKIFDSIKKNKKFIKIPEHLTDYINFDSIESNLNLQLNYIKKIEKDTTEKGDSFESYIILCVYKIKKINRTGDKKND